MASLNSFLPSAGSTVWRNERRATRLSSSGDFAGENGLSKTRIKHIVIREVWKRMVPSPHALYKVDVMTQSNHWIILHRYREFHSLHQKLVKHYGIPSDMLPAKTISSSMALEYLEKRRNALEHYLQRLINSHHDIAESEELFEFLQVETHDVLCVTKQLAKVLENDGLNILSSGSGFTFTPTEMYCITRQLQLPHVTVDQPAKDRAAEAVDLGYLYGFVQELKRLCVSGVRASKSSLCEELVSNQAFDISLFKSLEKLQIDKCHVSVIDGLFRIQKQLTHVTVRKCVKTMKEFLVDCAMQKRGVNQANSNVESWRNSSTAKLTENRIVVRPWVVLTHLDMSHNNIVTLDHSLKLLPALEQLDLSYNAFSHFDLNQLPSSSLTFLNIGHNNIHYISATSEEVTNLKSLLLSHNKLQNLDGLGCLRGLVELDVRNNQVQIIEEVAKISSLLHLRILALTGNPCAVPKMHRIQVFGQMKSRELILDGVKMNEIEKKRVQEEQARKVRDLPVSVTEPTTSCHTPHSQSHAAGHNNDVVDERDDDQDSGFGGNFAGSIDDGGLVFDWGCYGDTCVVSLHSTSHGEPSHAYQGGATQGNNVEGDYLPSIYQPSKASARSSPLLGNRKVKSHGLIDKGKWPRFESKRNACETNVRTEICSNSSVNVHGICSNNASNVHGICSNNASNVHGVYSNDAANVHGIYSNDASNVHEAKHAEIIDERGDSSVLSCGKNNDKYGSILSTSIVPVEEYNPFLDNALVLSEDNSADLDGVASADCHNRSTSCNDNTKDSLFPKTTTASVKRMSDDSYTTIRSVDNGDVGCGEIDVTIQCKDSNNESSSFSKDTATSAEQVSTDDYNTIQSVDNGDSRGEESTETTMLSFVGTGCSRGEESTEIDDCADDTAVQCKDGNPPDSRFRKATATNIEQVEQDCSAILSDDDGT